MKTTALISVASCILPAFVFFASGGCAAPCDYVPPGVSDTSISIAPELPGAAGDLEGVYLLTLTPKVSTSTCADAREADPEQYAYTLEVKSSGGESDPQVRVYVDGFPLAQGGQYVGGQLIFESDERVEEREGGDVTYVISGLGSFSADTFAGHLLWEGTERIEIIDSSDPDVRSGCIFEYDVSGVKVCSE